MEIKPSAETLELIARQVVEGFIIGLHKSPFHGFSVEFAEHRQYNPGDDLRHIDWRVYGRSERFFIKKHEEETNLRCCILLDTSSSMQFPEGQQWNKQQYGCLVAASLLQLLKRQLDASSLALFDERVYEHTECRSSPTHYRRLQQELARAFENGRLEKKSSIAAAIHQIAEVTHRRSLVVIISDMVEHEQQMDDLFDALQHLRYNKHEVILVQILARKEEIDFDFENRPYEFVDLETGEKTRLQADQLREQYRAAMNSFRKEVENQCYRYNIARVEVDLEEPVDQVLHAFLMKRNKMQ
jgi:uncharacterized protein (DUF58 family)